jgi:hypothetical protein
MASTLFVVGLGTSLFLYERALHDVDRQLSGIAGRVFSELPNETTGDETDSSVSGEIADFLPSGPPAVFLEAALSDGTVLFRSGNLKERSLPSQPPFQRDLHRRRRRAVGTFVRDGMIVRVAEDLDSIENLTANLTSAFLVASPFVLGLVIFAGRRIARTALRPIERITQSAEQVTAEHLDRRVASSRGARFHSAARARSQRCVRTTRSEFSAGDAFQCGCFA